MNADFTKAKWINPPQEFEMGEAQVSITTDPHSDFWQRSYYGFRNDNAHALQITSEDNFTFTVKVNFDYKRQFDQAGVVIYLDSQNWFKASIEAENEILSRLGSVVTNHGYSDWATTEEMGKMNPPMAPEQPIRFGVYACSPLDSSFTARFSEISLETCQWLAHG